jgi:two-component system LytT family sensor kinase
MAANVLTMEHSLEKIGREVESRPLWRRLWVRLVFIWLIWTFVGLIFTSQMYFGALRSEQQMKWSDAAFQQFSFCYLWALATPLVLWLSRRFQLERHNGRKHLLTHILFSLLLVIAISSAHQIIGYLRYGRPLGRPYKVTNTLRNISYNASENFATYGLIVLLFHSFGYYSRYRKGELKATQLESMLAQAQLQSLKMQLHPHFLFNTLHSINALLHSDTEAARRMLVRLGDFLRLTLDNAGTQEVTVQQEMEFLKGYLEIERIRFQDRLTVNINVEPQALNVKVPNLILQPIVENAIRHGIAPRSSQGLLEIMVKRENGVLRIEVRDNGPGLPVNHSSIKLFKGGVGLANTRARLDRLYGAAHRFELENNPAGGLTVTLEVPSTASNGHMN